MTMTLRNLIAHLIDGAEVEFNENTGNGFQHGLRATFKNGWQLSVQWHWGNYCDYLRQEPPVLAGGRPHTGS
jgi:hypothetical protein